MPRCRAQLRFQRELDAHAPHPPAPATIASTASGQLSAINGRLKPGIMRDKIASSGLTVPLARSHRAEFLPVRGATMRGEMHSTGRAVSVQCSRLIWGRAFGAYKRRLAEVSVDARSQDAARGVFDGLRSRAGDQLPSVRSLRAKVYSGRSLGRDSQTVCRARSMKSRK